MAFDIRRSSRPPVAQISVTPVTTATPTTPREQPPQAGDAARNRTTSRLKRISGRLSRPLSLSWVPGTSRPPSHQRTPNKLHKVSARNSTASRTSRAEELECSRRSSLLSTLPSSSRSLRHEDDEPGELGELPVFGVSQRAYLASLVSLFGSSNGSSYSASSPTTDPSSAASSLVPYEFDTHSPAIYKYARSRDLYVGWPELVHPPPEALLEFEMETLPLLERDLQSISGPLGQQGVRLTYELRMSGYASATGETVTLSPTVWILYRTYSSVGAQVSVAELRQAVADTCYLQHGLEIREGGGRIELSSDRGLVNVKLDEKESVELSDGAKAYVHVEDCHDKDSVCGALCCVTTDGASRREQGLCRLGGLLKINGKYILGVTTAHAMLDGSGIFRDSFDDGARSQAPAGQAVDRARILSETKRVSKWHNVTRDAAVDFLGISMNSRGEMAINRAKPENATNFALLRLKKLPTCARNRYIPPRATDAVSITSTASAGAAAMDEGPVYILCGGGDVADGQLIWGSACFTVRGRSFRVRRIQTSRPLSAGTTGAWVVRGEVLYGVIIAVYENEPFALMMTVERLFASILGSAFSIRSVEIWDGQVPEALKAPAQEQSSEAKNKVVPSKTRRPAHTESHPNPNGEGSSRGVHQAVGQSPTSRSNTHTAPEGVQPLSPRPRIVDGSSSEAEEPNSPRQHSPALESRGSEPVETEPVETEPVETEPVETEPVEASSATAKATRQTLTERTMSNSSEFSMSGAIPDDTPVDKGKHRVDTGDAKVSARTTYTTASEALDRPDSGFGQEASPTSNNRGGQQMPPIHPASETREMTLRGGASNDQTSGRNSEEAAGSSGNLGTTATVTSSKGHRSSNLQAVLYKTFRRPSASKRGSREAPDEYHGIPPTGLNSRGPIFHKRRSSRIEPTGISSSDDNKDGASAAVDSRGTLSDNNVGITPYGPDGSRPLSPSFLPRSAGMTSETGHSTEEGDNSTGSSAGLQMPLSYIRRVAGKPQKSRRPTMDNNFGIPHQGL